MKLKLFNKAQAALEFLTTYGWAFLVILIMIGALAYFGILSPAKLLPNRCNFASEFQCLDYAISGASGSPANQFRIRLKSNVGDPIDVAPGGLAVWTESSTAYACTAPALPANWKTGEIQELVWTTCSGGGIVSGAKGKVLVSVYYRPAGAANNNYAKNVSGEVYSTVQ